MGQINYKDRITNVLRIEKVAYQMEIARRINVLQDRTIKFVIKEMYKDGEINRSSIFKIGRLKFLFYWLTGVDQYTIDRVIIFKLMLMRHHLEYSNVQKNFGPKIAIASLKELARNGRFPLLLPTIKGPITKWAGPLNTWRGNEVTVPSGDIDVVALERGVNILWMGEVKMRADYFKKHQAKHFLTVAKNFRDKIFQEKGIYFEIKPFIVTPLAAQSVEPYCYKENIELIKCNNVYYPKRTSQRELEWFYREYKTVMGVPNLVLIDNSELPLPIVSMDFHRKRFRNTI